MLAGVVCGLLWIKGASANPTLASFHPFFNANYDQIKDDEWPKGDNQGYTNNLLRQYHVIRIQK